MKWSRDSSFLAAAWPLIASKKRSATSLASSRSRFLENVEWFHTWSSIDRPTNQRYSRLKSSSSISCRSERIAEQDLEQQRPQQLLRRDRRPPGLGVHALERGRELAQGLVDDLADVAQGVVPRDAVLERSVAEYRVLAGGLAAQSPSSLIDKECIISGQAASRVFQQPASGPTPDAREETDARPMLILRCHATALSRSVHQPKVFRPVRNMFTPMAATIRPMRRVMTLSPFWPRNLTSRSAELKQR